LTDLVYAAYPWKDNADLIADVNRLGYIRATDDTLDATFGKGNWWKIFHPNVLIAPADDWDFTKMSRFDSAIFDTVVFDPPYVSKGGRTTSTIPEMDNAYGMDDAPRTPDLVQQQIFDGLDEVHRVLKPRGIALVKCMNYISSGKLWLGAHFALEYALAIGFMCEEIFYHTNAGRPQPHEVQVHARNNLSMLYVLRKK
jgi:tRNA G10  N-methylase Trm11